MGKGHKNLALCEMQCNVVLRKIEKFKGYENYEKVKKFYEKELTNVVDKSITNRGCMSIEGAYKMTPKQFEQLVANWSETQEEVEEAKKKLAVNEDVVK